MSESNGTKNLLASSMKKLMSEKSFAKISITDICDGCGMNRKSFYYHFKDKYDLMNWIFYSDFIMLIGTTKCDSGWDLIEAVCGMFYKDQKFYKSAFKIEGQNSMREYLLESMLPIVDYLFDDVAEDRVFGEASVKVLCEAYIIAVRYWLDSGCLYPPHEFVESIRKLIKRLADEQI